MTNDQAQVIFDAYLLGRAGDFHSCLLQAMFHADGPNLELLRLSFPELVGCLEQYQSGKRTRQ